MSLPTVDPGTPGSNVDNFSLSAIADNENYRGALVNSQSITKHRLIPQRKITAGYLRIARAWIGNPAKRRRSSCALQDSRTIPSTGHTLPAAPPCQRLMPHSAQARKEAFASHHGGFAAMPPPTTPYGVESFLSPSAAH